MVTITRCVHCTQKRGFDRHQKEHLFQPDDQVWLYEHRSVRGHPRKLNASCWSRPYFIREHLADATYRIRWSNSNSRHVVNLDRRTLYISWDAQRLTDLGRCHLWTTRSSQQPDSLPRGWRQHPTNSDYTNAGNRSERKLTAIFSRWPTTS